MKTKYVPFSNEMLPEAGKLLAERHKRNRKDLPLLPSRFEEVDIAVKAVEALWNEKQRNGFAAFREGKLIAYLIGEMTTTDWGRCGYVYLHGYALAEGKTPAILQDLYTLLGEEWVQKGYFNHYLYVSSADTQILDALFDLGFGKEGVNALLDLKSVENPEAEKPASVTIRKAGKGDNALVGSLSNIIYKALAEAPYWHPTPPEVWAELHEGWSELPDETDWTVWLAVEQEKALGAVGFTPQEEDDTNMLASPKTINLSVEATQPEARGRGVGTALTWLGLEKSREAGFEVCYTNWISPNLYASRFWPRFGFKDVAYRVSKKVIPMIAWAK